MLHGLEGDRSKAGGFEDDIKRAVLGCRLTQGHLRSADVAGSYLFRELGVQVGGRCAAQGSYLEATSAQDHRCQQSYRSSADNGGSPGFPDPQSPLDLKRLRDALLGNAQRLSYNCYICEAVRHFDEVLRFFHVIFSEKPV